MPKNKFEWEEDELKIISVPKKLTPEEYDKIKEKQKDKKNNQ